MDVHRTGAIRQWWYLYAEVLRNPANPPIHIYREFLNADDAVVALGIVKPGQQMPRAGAEDLAAKCDRLRGLR